MSIVKGIRAVARSPSRQVLSAVTVDTLTAAGYPSGGGETSETYARKLSAVDRCIEILSDSMAKLPTYCVDRVSRKRVDLPLLRLLNVRPNEAMAPSVRKKLLESSRLARGNSYDWIRRNPYTAEIIELIPLPGELVYTWRDTDGHVWHNVQDPASGSMFTLSHADVAQYCDRVESEFMAPKNVDFHCEVPLYDYQAEAVDGMEKVYCGILQSAAGSGKTQMGIALAARLGRKTLWLTHTKDLLARFIPVFTMIVQAVTKAAQALAAFFNYELPEIDYSGISAGASAADDMADGLNDAAAAAKKLKSYTMGFDELNVINPNSGDSGSATPMGGGYASDFGLDPGMFEYDFTKGITEQSEKLRQKLETILKIALAIAGALAGWKIAAGVFGFFDMLSKLVSSGVIPSMAAGLKILAGAAMAGAGAVLTLSGAFEAWTDGLNSSNLTTMMEGTILLVAGLGLAFGPVGAAIGAAVGSIALFATAFKDLLENGFNDNNIMAFTVVTGAVIALTAAFGPVAALLAGVALAVTGVAVAMNTDAVPAIDIFDETISDTTREKVEPFIEKLRNLDDTLAGITFTGKIIDDSVVADVQRQTAAIVEAIVNELDADRNQALSTLAPLKKALGEEAYNELLASNTAYYDTVTTKVQEGEARINEIVAQARAEERTLTQAEADEITRIRDEMQNTGIQHLSETEIEYQTIMNRLKDNATRVSLEQASEIIKNAQTTRDETIAAAQTQYATVELEAQRMLGVGAINQEQYDAILLAAQTTRDESILAAQEQYQTIYDTTTEKLGDTAKYIDSETGAIKSKWDVFCDNVAQKWTQKWTDIKTGWTEWKSDFLTSWEECKTTFKTGWDTLWDNVAQKWTDWKANFMRGWEDFKTEFKRGWASFWTGIGNFFIGLWNGLVTAVEDACNIIIDMVNYVISKMGAILAFLGISIPQVSHIKLDRVEYLEVPAFEEGGFPDMGQFFLARESGAEMVGQIGRRTAVANNDQIVSGITNGVREGNGDLLSALFTICDRVVRSIEENGGDVVIGDETIGRANDRYQQTRGPKVSSGAFADAY